MVAVLLFLALRVGQLLLGLRVHVLVVGGALVHKRLYGPVQQQIQPAEQNQEVEEMQQYLLPVNIQWYTHTDTSRHSTKMTRMAMIRA